MHSEAMAFLTRALDPFKSAERVRVLEFGSRDVNGSPRALFEYADYVGVDIAPGPGVDVVIDAAEFCDEECYDIVICAEVFEHARNWREIVENAADHLLPGGMFLVTAASDPREAHSAVDGWDLRPGEFYSNISPLTLESALKDAGFHFVEVSTHPRGDVYAKALMLMPEPEVVDD